MLANTFRLGLAIICFCVSPIPQLHVQQTYTPPPSSAERKAIVDALCVPILRELKKTVIFQVSSLRVKDGWAVIWTAPLQPNGQPFDYRNTRYEKCRKHGDCDDSIGGVLQKQKGVWVLMEYAIAPTDVPTWGTGRKKYKLPAGLQ
jgi:hypothetical protein